ncbi:MAG: hypothetical protein JWM42_1278 [Burkholderia sp.]|nr:hypothetical protein [Burkholderia sp.]
MTRGVIATARRSVWDQKDAGSNCQRENDKKPYDGYICAFHDISLNDIGSSVATHVGGDLSKVNI